MSKPRLDEYLHSPGPKSTPDRKKQLDPSKRPRWHKSDATRNGEQSGRKKQKLLSESNEHHEGGKLQTQDASISNNSTVTVSSLVTTSSPILDIDETALNNTQILLETFDIVPRLQAREESENTHERSRHIDSEFYPGLDMVAKSPRPDYVAKLSEAFIANRDIHSEISGWKVLLTQHPESWDVRKNLHDAYNRLGDMNMEIKGWTELVDCHPWQTVFSQALGEVYHRLGNDHLRIAGFRNLVEKHPNTRELRAQLAVAYQKQAKIDVEIAGWAGLLEKFPCDADFREKLGKAYRRLGDINVEIAGWQRLVTAHPSELLLQEGLADAYKKKGDLKEELTGWLYLADMHPLDGGLVDRIAAAYERNGNVNNDIEGWFGLVRRHPFQEAFKEKLQEAFVRKGDLNTEITMWHQLIEQYPSLWELYDRVADAYKRKEDIQAETKIRRMLVEIYPYESAWRNKLEIAYRSQQDVETEIDGWTDLLRKFPSQQAFQDNLAEAYRRKANFEQEVTGWTELVVRSPGEKSFISHLKTAYKQVGNIDREIAGWLQLVRTRPYHWGLNDALADAYREKGDLDAEINIRIQMIANHSYEPDLQDKLMRAIVKVLETEASLGKIELLAEKNPLDKALRARLTAAQLDWRKIKCDISIWKELISKNPFERELHRKLEAACIRKAAASSPRRPEITGYDKPGPVAHSTKVFTLSDAEISEFLDPESYTKPEYRMPEGLSSEPFLSNTLEAAAVGIHNLVQSTMRSIASRAFHIKVGSGDNSTLESLLRLFLHKYPDAIEFQIARAFADVTSGQYYNGLEGLRWLTMKLSTSPNYANVLHRRRMQWARLSCNAPANFTFINRQPRCFNFHISEITQWESMTAGSFADSIAIMTLNSPSRDAVFPPPENGIVTFDQPESLKARMDTVGRLVEDQWGPLGRSILLAFTNLLELSQPLQATIFDKFILPYEEDTGDELYLYVSKASAAGVGVAILGETNAEQWDVLVDCLKWLLSITGKPQPEGGLKMRIFTPAASPDDIDLKGALTEQGSRLLEAAKKRGNNETYCDQTVNLEFGSPKPCWVDLISHGYISSPVNVCTYLTTSFLEEWTGVGLRLPFDLLVYISGVEQLLEVDGTPVLCGFQTALVPVSLLSDGSIQWHFIRDKSESDDVQFRWFQHRPQFFQSLPSERLRDISVQDLKQTAYLGWSSCSVTVVLGTIDPPMPISKSLLPQTRHVYIPSGYEFQGTLQITPFAPISVLFGVVKKYEKASLQPRFTPSENLFAMIDQLYSKQVIVYDDEAKTGVLCLLVNLVLSLVRGYLRANYYRYNSNTLNFNQRIENAQPEIRRLVGMVVETGLDFKFGDVFKIVTYRYSASTASIPQVMRCTRSGILGFEVADILGNNDDFRARKLALDPSIRTWRTFAEVTDVVFCKMFGDIVKTNSYQGRECSSYPPSGCNILVCPFPQLKKHFDLIENNCYKQRGRRDLEWMLIGTPFECHITKSGGSCDGLQCWSQRLQSVKTGLLTNRSWRKLESGKHIPLDGDGAVCFGRLIDRENDRQRHEIKQRREDRGPVDGTLTTGSSHNDDRTDAIIVMSESMQIDIQDTDIDPRAMNRFSIFQDLPSDYGIRCDTQPGERGMQRL